MGGKGSGNKMVAKNQAWKKSPVIGDNGIVTSPDEIAMITKHALEVALWDEIDTKDPDQLRDRTLLYLQYCIDNKVKPGNLGLYNAWGMTKETSLIWYGVKPTLLADGSADPSSANYKVAAAPLDGLDGIRIAIKRIAKSGTVVESTEDADSDLEDW